MNVYEAIMKRRTIRKFKQERVGEEILLKLVECAKMAAFGANMQALKYKIITDPKTLEKIYPLTKWAGYLPDWNPAEDERPTAYIAVLGDANLRKNKAFECDAGAAVTNMMLAAYEEGLGSCWLGAIDRDGLHKLFELDESLSVVYLLAVGYPAQKSEAVEMKDGDVRYYETADGKIHVPKRSLEEVLVK